MGQNDNSDGTAGIAGDKNDSGENSTINLENGQVHKEINDKSSTVDIAVAGTADRAGAVKIAVDHQTAERTEAVEITLDNQTAEPSEAVEITLDRQIAERTEVVEILVDNQTAEPSEAVEITVNNQTTEPSEAVDILVDRQTAEPSKAVEITVDRQTAETTEAIEIVVDRQTAEPSAAVEITVDRQTAELSAAVKIAVDHQTVEQTKPNDESKSGNDEKFDRKSNTDRSNERSPNQSSGSCCSIGKVDDAEKLQENTKKERSSSFSELTAIAVNDKGIDKTKKKSTNWKKFKCYFLLLLMFLLALWVVLYFSFITGYPIPFVRKVLESWGFKV